MVTARKLLTDVLADGLRGGYTLAWSATGSGKKPIVGKTRIRKREMKERQLNL
jgi:hypothetical protein